MPRHTICWPAIIRNGVLYGIKQDEEGWPMITKTVILNAEELPAGSPYCGSEKDRKILFVPAVKSRTAGSRSSLPITAKRVS